MKGDTNPQAPINNPQAAANRLAAFLMDGYRYMIGETEIAYAQRGHGLTCALGLCVVARTGIYMAMRREADGKPLGFVWGYLCGSDELLDVLNGYFDVDLADMRTRAHMLANLALGRDREPRPAISPETIEKYELDGALQRAA